MSSVFWLFLSLSFSGALLALIIVVIKPFTTKRFSKKWQYYVWLVVILRLLLPFTPERSPVGDFFQAQEQTIQSIVEEKTQAPNPSLEALEENVFQEASVAETADQQTTTASRTRQEAIFLGISLLWALVAILLFLSKIIKYSSFVKQTKKQRELVTDIEILKIYQDIARNMNIAKAPPLYYVNTIPSPMLVGGYRSFIALSKTKYSFEHLGLVLRHELTHYKRNDIVYKWLVQLTLCLHWFNPAVYFMSKEINKQCELSCDERVIKSLNSEEKHSYGESLLLSLQSPQKHKKQVMSMGLSDDGKLLKERLGAIMKISKIPAITKIVSVFLLIVLIYSGISIGAYAKTNNTPVIVEDFKELPVGQVLVDTISTGFSAGKYSSNPSFEVLADTDLYVSISATANNGSFKLLLTQNGRETIYNQKASEFALNMIIPVTKGEYRLTLEGYGISNTNISIKVVDTNGTGQNVEPYHSEGLFDIPEDSTSLESSYFMEEEIDDTVQIDNYAVLAEAFSLARKYSSQSSLRVTQEGEYTISTDITMQSGEITFFLYKNDNLIPLYKITGKDLSEIKTLTLKEGNYTLRVEGRNCVNIDYRMEASKVE